MSPPREHVGPVSGSRQTSPFIGRIPELGRLRSATEQARRGSGRFLLISGEAGVGKSRLLAEFATSADVAVVVGHCLELAPASYGTAPWLELVAAADHVYGTSEARRLARLLDIGASPGGPRRRSTVSDLGAQVHLQVLGAAQRWARRRPLLLILEDLHWSDGASLELLTYLAHNLAEGPVTLAATLTDGLIADARDPRALQSFLRRISRLPSYEPIHLAPLSSAEIESLLQSILKTEYAASRPAELVERSQGNPLFAEELAHFVQTGGEGVPESLADLFLHRLRRLPRVERRLLEGLAIAGRPMAVGQLAELTKAPAARAEPALRDLAARNLVVNGGTSTLSVRHHLAEAAIYANLSAVRRREGHQHLALILLESETRGSPPYWVRAESATHLAAAGRWEEAQRQFVRAARQASVTTAYSDAARCFAEAIHLLEANGEAAGSAADLPHLREAAAASAFAAGDFDSAITYIQAALDESASPPDQATRLRTTLGSYLLEAGRDSEAIRELETAIALMPIDASQSRTRALATLAAAWMLSGRYRLSLELCIDVRPAAEGHGDSYLESQVLTFLGVDLVNLGEVSRGLLALREAVRIAAASERTEGELETILNLAEMLIRVDQLDEAATLAVAAAQRADQLGLTRRNGAGLRSVAGEAMIRAGRWKEAEDVLTAGLRSAPQGKWHLSLLIALARLDCLRGDVDKAASHLDSVVEAAVPRSVDTWPRLAEVMGMVELARGHLPAAREVVQGALGALVGSDADQLRVPLLALAARIEAEATLSARRDRQPTLRRVAREAATRIGIALAALQLPGEVPVGIRAALASGRAEVARAVERPDPSLWREAGRMWEESGQPYGRAYSAVKEAEALLQSGARPDARLLLIQGTDLVIRLGAVALEREIRDVVRRARMGNLDRLARGSRRRRAGAAGTGIEALSSREREVLELIGRGMTNAGIAAQLFVSPATVATHVVHILEKLGVRTRREAAAVASPESARDSG